MEIRRALLEEYYPYPHHANPTITNYKNELLRIYDALEGQKEGQHFIRWSFSRRLTQKLTLALYHEKLKRKGKHVILHL